MSEKVMENNRVTVIGTIVSDFTFSHAGTRGGILSCGSFRQPSQRTGGCDPPYGFGAAYGA